ncbi:uncharacterized protein EV422DRAFT_565348 [Fimicolochytrium jonesii]|uniref:uncharacterized protein n=1 Tax=Fimicolochytrium jonesii TaxID=1396493 RepID=UPI0022FE8463|nr:uncharacterized protein EV422DRAFT_565348 [Fimicolochytrium jonesii]KAI8823398.1 hypothetical protein EV422DRAFT_565348 [Fimicolochytrium jonesii]
MEQMQKLRISLVSLDWLRPKDPRIALGHASIKAKLTQSQFAERLDVKDHSFNVNPSQSLPADLLSTAEEAADEILASKPDLVAFGGYVWNESYVQNIHKILATSNPRNTFNILMGPQTSYAPKGTLESFYPFSDIFIRGYAEDAFRDVVENMLLLRNERIRGVHHAGGHDDGSMANVDLNAAPSPFTEVIDLNKHEFIRWETQRGCPFRCTFCQHRDSYQKRSLFNLPKRIAGEIHEICSERSAVRDIAVLDPTFNSGPHYISVIEELTQRGYAGRLALQCRFEMMRPEFVEAVRRLITVNNAKVILEFGIQTIIMAEMKEIQRINNLEKVKFWAEQLHAAEIPFEISLIYGRPHQTVDTFKRSIDFCHELKPTTMYAWPLMLLRGTELERKKGVLQLEEGVLEEEGEQRFVEKQRILGGIPHVMSSPSFSKKEWFEMRDIAASLNLHEDYMLYIICYSLHVMNVRQYLPVVTLRSYMHNPIAIRVRKLSE